MVTMVTVNIFLIFSFDPNSTLPNGHFGHFGVLHDHMCASIGAWDQKKTSKKLQNRQKLTVSCAVTMVTVIIFLIFYFNHSSA